MKPFFIISIFLVVAISVVGQNLEDIFDMGSSSSQHGTITLAVDQEIYQENNRSDKAKQDSIKQLYQKWNTYFLEKNNCIQAISIAIQQLDTDKITAKEHKKLRRQLEDCKAEVTDYLNNNNDVSWKNFDDLVEMNGLFHKTCRAASAMLEDQEEKVNKEPPNLLLLVGVCLVALMAVIPVFVQIKSSITLKKTKKEQEKLAKKQQEEMEKQMLLSNENNIITIKE